MDPTFILHAHQPGRKDPPLMADEPAPDALLTPAEVARLFRVNPKTVSRWASSGKLPAIRTLGGHHRFRTSEILDRLRPVEDDA